MLNELLAQIRRYEMVKLGDHVICGVSGGADSMALLWGMYLLQEKLGIRISAAHYNHHLRGEESARDEAFVRKFCDRHDIELFTAGSQVVSGKKGLEAAAREARYDFFSTLPGKIATAHTADDNAETVLMHMVRGTGLKGLGGITPVRDRIIRPMLSCTRCQVLAFLQEHHIGYVNDSSNDANTFLRNRLRHQVMPLLKQENPRLAENLSAMAMELRQDETALAELAEYDTLPPVAQLRQMSPAVRSRVLEQFLRKSGVREPERAHITLAEKLVFSDNPSAYGCFPNGITVYRVYDRLTCDADTAPLTTVVLPESGVVELGKLRICVQPADAIVQMETVWTVVPVGTMVVRCRREGDTLCMPGGTKSLKKLFIDRKIPAQQRRQIPVIADEQGVIGAYGIGINMGRKATALPAVQIHFEDV